MIQSKGGQRSHHSSEPRRFGIIIGAMKSGTTSLFDLLTQHPEVAASKTKEPDFFAFRENPLAAWPEYLSLWDWKAATHRVALEASVAYTKAPWVRNVPERIHSIRDADFRFIYVMRHPLRRIESQVRHSLFEGWGKSLDEGMSADLLDFSRYAMQLDLYLEHFPRESILAVTLDELRDQPTALLQRCCTFLGVSPDFVFEGETERRNTGDFYTVSPAVGKLARNDHIRSLVKRALPRSLHQGLRKFLGRRMQGGASMGRWRMNPEEEAAVLKELAPDMRRLRDEFGIDVEDSWSLNVDDLR
jgi:hypothetical protein